MHKNPAKDKQYIVSPSRLEGKVQLSGAKNSALRLLAASLLTSEAVVLENYPSELEDAKIHVGMLEALGKRTEIHDDQITITEDQGVESELDWQGRSIRNTLLILGALTARSGRGAVPLPGGCKIGERNYDLHVMLLEKLGADVWCEGDMLCAESKGRLKGADIHLPLRSTGATENSILCGCLAQGITRVWNPHIRPEIMDLIALLRKMGAKIRVFGQEHIEIVGQEGLQGAKHYVIPDNMEALTWLVGSMVTGGDVEILDFPYQHLEVPLIFLRESGAKFYRGDNGIIVRGGSCYPVDISTGPYPGINSDMQPLFAVLGVCSKGESHIVDLRFPGRYVYAEELKKLGANINVRDNMLVINGGAKLKGAEVNATDLRAGICLVLTGLVAEGETSILNSWQIDRGYNNFMEKMQSLGGVIGYSSN